jgi:hypothetical protein
MVLENRLYCSLMLGVLATKKHVLAKQCKHQHVCCKIGLAHPIKH